MGSRQPGLPVPLEITLQIFSYLDKHNRGWSLALTSKYLYNIAREHVLFRKLRLGWWPDGNQCDEAKANFEPTADLNAKLKADIRTVVERFKIGGLIRDLEIAFAEGGITEKDRSRRVVLPESTFAGAYHSEALMDGARSLFSVAGPRLQRLSFRGTQSAELYREVIELAAAQCLQMDTFAVNWWWSHGQPDYSAPFGLRARFPKLKDLTVELDVDCGSDSIELEPGRGYLGKLAEPVIRAAWSPTLRDLRVVIENEIEDDAVDWTLLDVEDKCVHLRSLNYQLAATLRPVAAILQDMSAVCQGVEDFTYGMLLYDKEDALDFKELLPWFAKLRRCKEMKLIIEVPVKGWDLGDDVSLENRIARESEASYAIRRRFLRGFAMIMPMLFHITWVDYGDICEEIRNQLEMLVERDVGGTPTRLGFRKVPVIDPLDLDSEPEHVLQLIHDTTEYGFVDL